MYMYIVSPPPTQKNKTNWTPPTPEKLPNQLHFI